MQNELPQGKLKRKIKSEPKTHVLLHWTRGLECGQATWRVAVSAGSDLDHVPNLCGACARCREYARLRKEAFKNRWWR